MANLAKFNTRIQLKFDTWANWDSAAGKDLVPLKGEVCVCEVPENITATGELITEKAYLFKVGNGESKFVELPWLSALAADVHSWAKYDAAKFARWATNSPDTEKDKDDEGNPITSFPNSPELATTAELEAAISGVAGEIQAAINTTVPGLIDTAVDTLGNSLVSTGSTTKTITGIAYDANTNRATVTYGNIAFPPAATIDTEMSDSSTNAVQNKVIKAYVDSGIAGINNKITNAMYFLGITTTPLSDGDDTIELAGINGAVTNGAVVIAPYEGKDGEYEFVWTGTAWEMLGQEGSFAVKGSIVDTDISSNAAIDPEKIKNSLSDSTNLKTDLTGLNNRIGALEEKDGEQDSDISTIKSFSKVNTVEADGKNDTLTIAEGTSITVTDDTVNDKITIAHANVTRSDSGSTTLTPAHGGSFTIIESVTTNDQGHVTSVQPRQITLPSVDAINSNLSGLGTQMSKTWKTETLVTASSTNTPGSIAGTAKSGNSDLNIAGTNIAYIVFDCGSATENV